MSTKITGLTALTTPADGDLLPIVDVSDTTHSANGTTKKITRANYLQIAGAVVGTTDTQTLTNKTLTNPKINEAVNLTATSTELNQLDGVTAGTVTASKAVVVDASKAQDEVHTAALYIGAGAGTQVTSTAAELNITDGGQTTEKVLNVQSKCSVYLTGSQINLVNGNATKILLDTENYDIGSDFDTTNSRFVAPVTGYYVITASVGFQNPVADKRYVSWIYVNGSAVAESKWAIGNDTGIQNIPVSSISYVTSGQYIELYATSLAGVDTVDIASTQTATRMDIHLLSI